MDEMANRHVKSIEYAIRNYPVVALIGARQTGKSTLLKYFAQNSKVFDLERQFDFDLIHSDPEFFLENQKLPIFIDEAQLSDKLFKAIRVFVDKNRKQNGQIILSGSSSSDLMNNISESLAGRISIIRTFPLALSEIENQDVPDFYNLLKAGKVSDFSNLIINKKRTWSECVWWGGYPEPVTKRNLQFKNNWCDNYIQTYIDRDIRRLFPDLQIETYRRFIRMLAMSSGEIINYAEWSSALGVSEPTVKKYTDIAQGTFIFRKLSAYANHPTKRLIKSPKGYIADTGLLAALLRIESPEDILAHPRAGFLFEIFCIEQIIKSLNAKMIPAEFSFYRTKDKEEVDLVIEFAKHKVPVEIKLGKEIRKDSLKTMNAFLKDYKTPFGIYLNNSEEVVKLSEGIYQIPFGAI